MTDLTIPPKNRETAPTPFGWLRTEIDRLFDDFAPARSIFNFSTSGLAPALEMTAGEKEYRLSAELPGLKEDDVELSVADGMLTLKGEKRDETDRKEGDYLLSERRYGSFERRIALPSDVDAGRISADFKKGILTITLPKDESVAERARKIAITTNS